jgi:hypothetical protein
MGKLRMARYCPLKALKMNELLVASKASDWQRLKALGLDSVSSPITKRVYNLGLDEFFAWYSQEPRAGLTKATVSAWRVTLEARGLGSVSITYGSPQCGSCPSRPQTTGCWHRNSPLALHE